MSIKYVARGISTQFRTPSELVTEDGVTLKPVDDGEVFVQKAEDGSVYVGTAYDSETGGCTVDETTYPDTASLNSAGLYVLSNALTAWDVSGDSAVKANIGVADVYKEDELIGYCTTSENLTTYAQFFKDTVIDLYNSGLKISYDISKTYSLTARAYNNKWWDTTLTSYTIVNNNGFVAVKRVDGTATSYNSVAAFKYTVS